MANGCAILAGLYGFTQRVACGLVLVHFSFFFVCFDLAFGWEVL